MINSQQMYKDLNNKLTTDLRFIKTILIYLKREFKNLS